MTKKDPRFDHKGRYVPILNRLGAENRNAWEHNAPRMTEDQKRSIQRITRGVYERHMKDTVTRSSFNKLHERIEEEVSEAIKNNLGLIGALEWRVIFGESAIHYFKKAGMPNPAHIDGVLPTNDFIDSDLFDYIEVFEPVVTLQSFEDYDKYIKSAEMSVTEAEKRRKQGDAYFTDLDRKINFRPDVGTGDSLDQG